MKVWPCQTIFIIPLSEGIVKAWVGRTIVIIELLESIGESIARSDNIHYSIVGRYCCKYGQVIQY